MPTPLTELLERTLPGLGYELVDVEDCAAVSNHLTRLFAVENIDYERLEVSSPGLDRPLTKLADYIRFAGQEAQLKLREPIDGARRMKGTLRGVEGESGQAVVMVETSKGRLAIPYAGIERARLVPQIAWRK